MRTVAVAIKKGGSCKATTAVSVASCAAQEHGLRVLLIDLDSAGSATTWLGGISRVASAQVLAGDVSLAVAIERTPSGVHVCGGGPWLEAIEMRLVAEVGRELVLRDSLRDVSDRFDLTILDCPPTEGLLTLNALVAADEVWAAVVPAPAEIGGLPRLEQLVTKVAARLNPNLAISAVIPCRYDARKRLYAEGLAILLERYGDRVTTRVPAAVRVEESISASEPIGTFDRLSPAAIAYRVITARLLGRPHLVGSAGARTRGSHATRSTTTQPTNSSARRRTAQGRVIPHEHH